MILRALLLRPILRRPLRTVVTVLGVAVGVASVVSTVAASRAAVRSFAAGVDEVAGRARLELTGEGGLPDSVLARLRPLAADAVLAPVVEEVAPLSELGDAVRVLGVDVLADRQVRPVEVGGEERIRELLLEHGALLPRPLARRLGVGAGAKVTVVAQARPQELAVVGVFEPPSLAAAWDRVLVVDVATAQELFGRQGRLDRVELVPRPGVSLDELRTRLAALAPPGARVEAPSRRRQSAEEMVASLRFNLVALSGISVLVAGVLVATTLATSVVQRRYSLSLLRSLGASRRQVAAALLAEAAVIGVLGGVLGVAGGFVGARLAVGSVRTTVAAVLRGIPSSPVRLEPWLALGGLALAVVTALVAAALPLAEAARTPPLQGLRGERPERLGRRQRLLQLGGAGSLALLAFALTRLPAWHGLPVAALLAALALMAIVLVVAGPLVDALARLGARPLGRLGVVWRVAAAALAAGRRRAAWAAGAVGVAVALAVAVATMVVSFRASVEGWTTQGLRADIWVRPMAVSTGMPIGRLDPEVVRIIEGLFGREATDPFYSVDVQFRGRPVELAGAAFDVVRLHGGIPFFGGRTPREVFDEAWRRHGVIVNEPFARRFRVARGDVIQLPAPSGSIPKEVIGVFHDYSRSQGLIVMDRVDFLALYPGQAERGPRQVAVFLPAGTDGTAARERLMAAVRGRFLVDALVNRELRREVLAAFERTFAITTALYLVAAVVAVVAVATVLFALIGERRRELGLLRAVGASRRQVAGVVLAEAALLGLAAAGAGIVVGLVVGVDLVKVVNLQSFGWSLELVLPWREVLTMGLWVTAACVVAAVAPALAAARMAPGEVLREEA